VISIIIFSLAFITGAYPYAPRYPGNDVTLQAVITTCDEQHTYRHELKQTCYELLDTIAPPVHEHVPHTPEQFAQYYHALNFSQADILAQRTCYMSDEFVAFAQTLSGYDNAIYQLSQECERESDVTHFFKCLTGTYTWGLTERLVKLRTEIEHRKKVQAHRQEQEHLTYQETLKKQELRDQVYKAQALQMLTQDQEEVQHIPALAQRAHQLAQRHHAAEQVYAGNTQEWTCQYYILSDTASCMEQWGISNLHLTTCSGNILHHELHTELIHISDRAADYCRQGILSQPNILTPDLYTDSIKSVACYAFERQQAHDAEQVARALNFCYIMLDYIGTATQGVLLGVGNTINAIAHPIDTIESMCVGSAYLAWGAVYLGYTAGELTALYLLDTHEFNTRWHQLCTDASPIIESIQDTIGQMNGPERVKHIVAFATEFAITHKPTAVGMKLAGHAQEVLQQAHKLKSAVAATKIIQNTQKAGRVIALNFKQSINLPKINTDTLVRALHTAEQKALRACENILEPLHGKESALQPQFAGPTAPATLKFSLSEGSNNSTLSSVSTRPSLGNSLVSIYPTNNIPPACRPCFKGKTPFGVYYLHGTHPQVNITRLQEFYDALIIAEQLKGPNNKLIGINYQHFMSLEKSYRLHEHGCISNIIYSIHHDYGKYYEQNGLLKLQNKRICPKTGFYDGYIPSEEIGKIPKYCSFFPSDWMPERVLDEILYALKHTTKIEHCSDGKCQAPVFSTT
jgi:hypothetical protein